MEKTARFWRRLEGRESETVRRFRLQPTVKDNRSWSLSVSHQHLSQVLPGPTREPAKEFQQRKQPVANSEEELTTDRCCASPQAHVLRILTVQQLPSSSVPT